MRQNVVCTNRVFVTGPTRSALWNGGGDGEEISWCSTIYKPGTISYIAINLLRKHGNYYPIIIVTWGKTHHEKSYQINFMFHEPAGSPFFTFQIKM